MVDPLIASRAVHFASSLLIGGTALYSAFIAQLPQKRQQQLTLAALVVAVVSGATWLLFLASKIAQSSVAAVIRDGTALSVLTKTQFGRVWLARLLILLPFCVGLAAKEPPTRGAGLWLATLAVLFVGSLAWSGHGAGTIGLPGYVHFGGDACHLISASAWVGGLVPLLMFIGPRVFGSEPPLLDCFNALKRFSTLAAWSVAVLAATGFLNTWFMTNGLRSFIGTEYGNLVLIKIALFLAMLGLGKINRYWLTPRLLSSSVPSREKVGALRLLCASVSFEIAFGFIVICVVAVLGQLPPPGHMHHAV